MHRLNDHILSQLSEILSAKQMLVDQDELSPHLCEWRNRWQGKTPLMVLPASVEQIAKIVKLCGQNKINITSQGGNTGLVGGQIPQGELLLNTKNLDRIRHLDAQAMTITVEAGVSLQAVIDAASKQQLLFALEIASGGSATIGGAIATNAGGMGVLRYGSMRAMVLGLEVVMPNGEIWHGLSGLHKDNTGYDLKQLFIGSEGTLGVITAATLRLFAMPKQVVTAWCALDNPAQGIELLRHLQSSLQNQISKFELISSQSLSLVLQHIPNTKPVFDKDYSWQVLVEFGLDDKVNGQQMVENILAEALQKEIIIDAVIAKSKSESASLLSLRESISAAQKPEGAVIKHDISLIPSLIPDFLQQAEQAISCKFPGTRFCVFGHLGDGNLHYNLVQPVNCEAEAFLRKRDEITQLVHDLVHKLGGSFSAEHGIGIAKIADMQRYKSPVELAMMRAIKQAIDPNNIMNPRVLFQQKN